MKNKMVEYISDSISLFGERMVMFHRGTDKLSNGDFLKFFWVAQVLTIVLSLIVTGIGLTYGWVFVHLVLFVPIVVAMIGRVKDMGISPWFVLVILVSFGAVPVGWFLMILLCVYVPTDALNLNKSKRIK